MLLPQKIILYIKDWDIFTKKLVSSSDLEKSTHNQRNIHHMITKHRLSKLDILSPLEGSLVQMSRTVRKEFLEKQL